MIGRRNIILAAVAGALWIAGAPAAIAQGAWPAKPVRVIVPFAPGGATDVVARMLGQKLSELWGQPVSVENRAGAGGNIGADLVAKSPPDGYTLLMASGSILTVNPHIYKTMPFDAKRDFVPITKVASGPMLIVVPETGGARTLAELIATARARPGGLRFGSAGIGSQVHMAAENFADAAKIDIVHIPYKGEAPAYTDLIGGQTQLMVGNFAAASALLGNGRLRALAVTGPERSKALPDVPTASEAGLPGFENTGWFGLLAPAGTPAEIIAKVHDDTARVLGTPDARARLDQQGMFAVNDTPADFAKAIEAEFVRWGAVVRNRAIATN